MLTKIKIFSPLILFLAFYMDDCSHPEDNRPTRTQVNIMSVGSPNPNVNSNTSVKSNLNKQPAANTDSGFQVTDTNAGYKNIEQIDHAL